ncbi:MAG: XrtA system polysaccharide chain length determinant [Rhodanobacteraceae bacterium]
MANELIPANAYSFWLVGGTMAKEAKRRRLALGILFAAIALLALVLGLLWPKKYEATTTILVQENNIIKPLTEGLAAPTEVADRAGIAQEVIFSRSIMNKILVDGGWMKNHPSPLEQEDLIKQIQDSTTITSPRPDLLQISYADTDPVRSYNVTRDMTHLFIEASLASKQKESTSAYEFMNSQVLAYAKKLTASGEKLKNFLETHADAAPGNQVDTNTRIAQLRQEMEAARIDIAELGSKSATLGGQLSGQSEIAVAQTREGVYGAQIAQLQAKLAQLKLTYTDSYPDVIRTRHQIDDLRQQMKQAETQKAASQVAGTPIDNVVAFNPVYQDLTTKRADVRGDLAAAEARLAASSTQLKQELERSKRVAATADEMAALTSDYNINQQIYQDLLKRREQARVSMELDKERRGLTFQIQDPAMIPLVPSGLRLAHFAAAGIALAALIPIGLLFGVSRYDPRVRSRELLEYSTGLPVLATIPHFQTPEDDRHRHRRNLLIVLIAAGVAACYLALFIIRTWMTT